MLFTSKDFSFLFEPSSYRRVHLSISGRTSATIPSIKIDSGRIAGNPKVRRLLPGCSSTFRSCSLSGAIFSSIEPGGQMTKPCAVLLTALVLMSGLVTMAQDRTSAGPETVVVHNGPVTLHALLWRPRGRGPFPAILLNHGSGRTREELKRLGPYEQQADILGPVFARHGYVFLFLFRRGVGLSADQGTNAVDLMNGESSAHGQEARNKLQLQLLENRELSDALAGLAFLRALPDVDPRNVALVGHSFGGSLSLLMAEREPKLRAIVVFSCAGYSWDQSPQLRERLLTAMEHIGMPVFFLHAANDYSLAPGKELDARLQQLGKPHLLKIYPPIGKTADDGHAFPILGVSIWEPDVFAFLDEHMQG
jgi:carboxymethylenebutenolidase